MRSLLRAVVAVVSIVPMLGASAGAAGLRDAKVALKVGNWTVLRTVNTMTDAIDCVGIYKDNYSIQLAKDKLFVGIRGGMSSVTLRLDDNPPQHLRLASQMEKDLRSIIIQGVEFDQVSSASRLRYEVLTLISGVASDDLDLQGLPAALTSIKSNCPIEATATESPQPSEPQSASLCSSELIARMKSKGLKESQIKGICDK